ncbi:hypothetical protein [Pseudocnuella soli]|uniref:hypothetical protein n=1 Tax=Pseudocnuella soli TaxID=2502779 RepID=UPI0010533A24|nr:hypothetical protein [Pseudocnuella soli]
MAPIRKLLGTVLDRTNRLSFLRAGQPADLDTIPCSLNGKTNGNVNGYHNWALLGVHIQGDVATSEKLKLHYDRMTSRENEVQIQSYRGRAYNVTVAQKIGLGKDFLKIPVNGLPADARKPATFNSFPKIWNWRKMEVEPLGSMKRFG